MARTSQAMTANYSSNQRHARAVDHILHGERGEQHAEQPRQHGVGGGAHELRDHGASQMPWAVINQVRREETFDLSLWRRLK